MSKKRLEDALNAGKLISLGLSINDDQLMKKLDIVYCINCQANFRPSSKYGRKKNSHGFDERYQTEDDIGKIELVFDQSELDQVAPIGKESQLEILSLQFNQYLNTLALGDSDGFVGIVNSHSGSVVEKSREASSKIKLTSSELPVISLKWSPLESSANFVYMASSNGTIALLDTATMKKLVLAQEDEEIACVDLSIDGAVLASVGKDPSIRLYDVSRSSGSGAPLRVLGSETLGDGSGSSVVSPRLASSQESWLKTDSASTFHTNRLQSVKFSNMSSDIFFTGGWDRTVKIWDMRTKRGIVNSIHGPFICGGDAIDVDDNLLLTASWVKENALVLWDLRDCTQKLLNLPISSQTSAREATEVKDSEAKKGEFLYACKFYSPRTKHAQFSSSSSSGKKSARSDSENLIKSLNFSAVLACGSGTQSLHLVDFQANKDGASQAHQVDVIECKTPLYCLDVIGGLVPLGACGGVNRLFGIGLNVS